MYAVSQAFQNAIKSNTRTFALKMSINTAETEIFITDSDIEQGSFSITEAVVNSDYLTIGSAVSSDLSFTLLDFSGKFTDIHFMDGIVKPQVGLVLPDGSTEWVPMGTFNIDDVSHSGKSIAISAADNMLLFDAPFCSVTVTYPCTALALLQTICNYCGVGLKNTSFTNFDLMIAAAPDADNATCRDIVTYIAQLAGCYAIMTRGTPDTEPALELAWFDTIGYVTQANIDGNNDTAQDYDSQEADGGNFLWYDNKMFDGSTFRALWEENYLDGNTDGGDGGDFSCAVVASIDGGGFWKVVQKYSVGVNNRYNLSKDYAPVLITGIKNKIGSDSILIGADNYTISIESNPFLQDAATAQTILQKVMNTLSEFCYLPFESSWQGDPALQPGDVICLVDQNGVEYNTIVTNSTFVYHGAGAIKAKTVNKTAKARSYKHNN